MTREELRATFSLSSLFALRMLGLFFILPVFAVHARGMPGANGTWIGVALGAYGLTQGLLQIPFGMASDRFGRKRTIVAGLLIFALGSFVAAAATQSGTRNLSRSQRWSGPKITASMAASRRGSRNPDMTRRDRMPKRATSPRITPKETSRVICRNPAGFRRRPGTPESRATPSPGV